QGLPESRQTGLSFWIGRVTVHQHPDPPHTFNLLPPRPHRPCRRAAAPRDELAPPHHSISSSASASSDGGTDRSSMRAVSALMTNSSLFNWTTGRSAGLAPLRMRPT